MPTTEALSAKQAIQSMVQSFSSGNLAENATKLFDTLGYRSNLALELSGNGKDDFIEAFDVDGTFRRDKALFDEWTGIRLLFQLTADHIREQDGLFTNQSLDRQNISSYLFFAVELCGDSYARGKLAQITREINKLTKQPALVLFKHGNTLTLAVIDRRLHKRDEARDVLEKVTLIKDINISRPHRAHIDILFDLSLSELVRQYQVTNWVKLHDAWRKTLNISELNKKFYRSIADWFYWAVDNVEYPLPAGVKDQRQNNSINVIRLLTRIIFVWFLREKHLVPDDLFDEAKLVGILRNPDVKSAKKSQYYRGVLQNLFFATLNQKMNTPKKPHNREWVSEKRDIKNRNEHFTIVNKYRFPELFKDPNGFLQLVSTIPFLNGGLFDCLDKGNEDKYVDGFTRRQKYQPAVPNMLFFGDERTVNLSEVFEDKKRSKEKVKGLIHILNDYKFTIAENTPIEEEVALDPELLGRVFENLLAAYNPETGTTARKATGSFYTPREIVNYMVDESLLAYLKTRMLQENPAALELGTDQTSVFGNVARKGQLKFEGKVDPNRWIRNEAELEKQLRLLLSYTYQETSLAESEKSTLIEAIHSMKVLDPACGSGAFPMGVLLKVVHVLHKLDKENVGWKELQRRKAIAETEEAFKIGSKEERETILLEINEAFDTRTNFPDYARKLFLIQNCIYGVDIQPIAVQISKLRFFISLLVDQNSDENKENRGVLSLPNLETKFVAANTLIGIEPHVQESMVDTDVRALEQNLNSVRRKTFTPRSYSEKKQLQELDRKLRTQLSELIEQRALEAQSVIKKQILELEKRKKASEKKLREPDLLSGLRKQHEENVKRIEGELEEQRGKLLDKGLIEANARRLADWDPYDQNGSAEFFDKEWMFGISDGFNLVLGNPPYIRQEEIGDIKPLLAKQYECYTGTTDLYVYFYELGIKLLKLNGAISYISSNKFFRARYGQKLRSFLVDNTAIKTLIDFGDRSVFEATSYPCVMVATRTDRTTPEETIIKARTIASVDELERFAEVVGADCIEMRQSDLSVEEWRIEDRHVLEILNTIKRAGETLEQYVSGGIYRGIVTGYNEAFVIDGATKRELINEDANSRDFIKPFLRGRDIGRYSIEHEDLHLLFIPWHFPLHEDPGIEGASRKAEDKLKREYPAVYNHLLQHKPQLATRNETETGVRYEWYALQRCAATYWREMEKPKIVWGNLGDTASFAMDHQAAYVSAPACIIPREDYYLLALLNSKAGDYFFHQIAAVRRGGYLEYKPMYVSRLPIPPASDWERRTMSELVRCVLYLRNSSHKQVHESVPNDHVSSFFEDVIDGCVYELYFRDHVHEKGIDVLRFLRGQLQSIEDVSQDQAKKVIRTTYETLRQQDNQVRNRLLLIPSRSPDLLLSIIQTR